MTRVVVTGGRGQLGQAIAMLAKKYPDLDVLVTDRDQLDFSQADKVEAWFAAQPIKPRYLVHAGAYTAVDKAETEQDLAFKVNAQGAAHLAKACAAAGARMLYVSTDYVYHGARNKPIREDAPTSPQGVYAQSKLEGERLAQAACPATMILRTSWVYAAWGHNFVNTIKRLSAERPSLGIVADQIGSPTSAVDLAQAILDIIQRMEAEQWGDEVWAQVYHYSNEGACSWYDFAQAILEFSQNTDCKLHPIDTEAYPLPAPRPPFSLLHKGKIKAQFGLEIPHWRKSLAKLF